jgi:enoyl-CoA hydratase
MPHTPIELVRNRLTPSALQRALSLAEEFTPETALAAGFLDKLVPAEELLTAAHSAATAFFKLDSAAHTGTKERIRHELLARLDEAIERDELDLRKYFGLL